MKTLVLVEHEGGQIKDATLSTVTAAAKLGEVHLLVAGSDAGGVAEQAAKIAGVGKVHVANDPALQTNEQRVHVRPALLKRLAEAFRHHEVDDLSAKLDAAKLPYAPIRRPEQLFDDPHLRASGGLAPMRTEDCGAPGLSMR